MPGVLVHVRFAEIVLGRWLAEGRVPFDPGDDRCRMAFVHGALGPDIGYFPRGDALLSELAHRLRTGRMAARLLAGATDDAETAFACGWITHVAADVRLHPVVEIEAARIARTELGRPAASWNASGSPVDLAHVRVEVGLDAVFGARRASLGRRLRPVFDSAGAGFLASAFNDVYGNVTSAQEIHVAHQSVAHWHRCLVPLLRWMTADWSLDESGPARLVAPLLRAREGGWVKYVGAGPVAAAFVSPVRPSSALVQRFEEELVHLADVVDQAVFGGVALPDLDLEDGHAIREAELKPAAFRTMIALEARIAERTGMPVTDTRAARLRVA